MFSAKWFALTMLVSISAFGVSLEEKKNRVEYLEELTSNSSVSMNIDAYKRSFGYEKNNISLQKRTELETNLFAEKVKLQVVKAYDASLEKTGNPDDASFEVRSAIENDLALVDASLRDELRNLALSALESAQRGEKSEEVNLDKIEQNVFKNLQEQQKFFNVEGEAKESVAFISEGKLPARGEGNFATKQSVLEALTADVDGAPFISSNLVNINSSVVKVEAAEISMQIQTFFMGVYIEAGPTIVFSRRYTSNVLVTAEGMEPALLPTGHFNFKRETRDKPRRIIFVCNTGLEFESLYSGKGALTVMGLGPSVTKSNNYNNIVNLGSRRIPVPETIDGKIPTLKDLSDICNKDFLKAKISSTMTVESSLNIMMKSLVANLSFTHPKTQCAVDSHCLKWFNKEILSHAQGKNIPRCIENEADKYRACEVRGLEGQNCTVLDKSGKRISSGNLEFACDKGLKCVQTKEAGWFKSSSSPYQFAEGKCMPINAATYRKPVMLSVGLN